MASKDTKTKSPQTITGDSLAKTIAFNGQCFLISQMFNIVPRTEELLKAGGIPRAIESVRSANISDAVHVSQGEMTDAEFDAYMSQTSTDMPNPNDPPYDTPDTNALLWSGLDMIAPILSTPSRRTIETFSKIVMPGGPTTKPNDPPRVSHFLNLTTDKMALLVPKLQIFKVEYETIEERGKKRPNLKKSKDIEIIFDDFTTQRDLDRIFMERQGRMSGTGIKSFSWSLKGVNPAEVDANITAELTIRFNDVSDLFTDQNRNKQFKAGRAEASSFLDLIIYAPHAGKADATASTEKDRKKDDHLVYDGKFFEIKAVVGWQVPPGSQSLLTSDEVDIIKKTQIPLYLQLTRHKFNFNQDGSADLVINYRARYVYKGNEHDLFNIENTDEYIEFLEAKAEAKKQKETAEVAGTETPESPGQNEELEEAQAELDSALKNRYHKFLVQLVDKERLFTAWANPTQLGLGSNINEGLNEISSAGNLAAVSSGERRLREGLSPLPGDLTQEQLTTARLAHALDTSTTTATDQWNHEASANALAGVQTGTFGEDFANFDPGIDSPLASTNARIHEELQQKLFEVAKIQPYIDMVGDGTRQLASGRIDVAMGEEADNHRKRAALRGTASLLVSNARNHEARNVSGYWPVTYFLLGDLLEIVISACKGIRKEFEANRIGIMTTDIEFFDMEAFYTTSVKYQGGPGQFYEDLRDGPLTLDNASNFFKQINIASIPIQYDMFVEWFMRKVVQPKRQRYFFEDFLSDILTGLVAPALSAKCFFGVPQSQTKISYVSVMTDDDSNFTRYFYPEGDPPASEKRMGGWTAPTQAATIDQLIAHKNILPPRLTVESSPGGAYKERGKAGKDTHRNFKVLMMTSAGTNHLKGDPDRDLQRGIYHFVMGADSGLLKEATFERMDAPYLREARISRDRALGAEQLRELYNVNLKLYGNTLIKPGQYIYVVPSPLGFGNPAKENSVARYLGIGGYHLVTGVESRIDRNGFETRVKALHQSMPHIKGN